MSNLEDKPKLSLKILALVIASSIVVLGTLLIIELGMRLSSPNKTPRSQGNFERPRKYFISPSAVDIRCNNLKEWQSADFRIIIVGDSFTFAPKMQAEDAFAKRLERWLNYNSAQKKVSVYSLGTPGFAAKQEAVLLQEFVSNNLKTPPNLIISEITLNDARIKTLKEETPEIQAKFAPFKAPDNFAWFFRHSRLLSFIGARIHNANSYKNYLAYHHDSFKDAAMFNDFQDGLKRMRKTAGNVDAKFTFMLFPLLDFALDQKYPFAHEHVIISDLARKLEAPLLDLFETFKGLDIKRLQLIPGSDSHPNEIAHRLAAESLLSFLIKSELIPQELTPGKIYKHRDNVREKQVNQQQGKTT